MESFQNMVMNATSIKMRRQGNWGKSSWWYHSLYVSNSAQWRKHFWLIPLFYLPFQLPVSRRCICSAETNGPRSILVLFYFIVSFVFFHSFSRTCKWLCKGSKTGTKRKKINVYIAIYFALYLRLCMLHPYLYLCFYSAFSLTSTLL